MVGLVIVGVVDCEGSIWWVLFMVKTMTVLLMVGVFPSSTIIYSSCFSFYLTLFHRSYIHFAFLLFEVRVKTSITRVFMERTGDKSREV